MAIKFDEIMYLTLQLPVNKKHKGTVYFVPLDHSKPRIKVVYELPKDSNIRQLRRHIGKILGYDPEKVGLSHIGLLRFFATKPVVLICFGFLFRWPCLKIGLASPGRFGRTLIN